MTSPTSTVRRHQRSRLLSLANISVTVQLWIQVFWVISVQFDLRNTLPKSGPFLLLHPVYVNLNKTTSQLVERGSIDDCQTKFPRYIKGLLKFFTLCQFVFPLFHGSSQYPGWGTLHHHLHKLSDRSALFYLIRTTESLSCVIKTTFNRQRPYSEDCFTHTKQKTKFRFLRARREDSNFFFFF